MHSFIDKEEDDYSQEENKDSFKTMLNCMDDEKLDYEAAEEIYDTSNNMNPPYQDASYTQCNKKEDGTTHYARLATSHASQNGPYTNPKSIDYFKIDKVKEDENLLQICHLDTGAQQSVVGKQRAKA